MSRLLANLLNKIMIELHIFDYFEPNDDWCW